MKKKETHDVTQLYDFDSLYYTESRIRRRFDSLLTGWAKEQRLGPAYWSRTVDREGDK